MTYFVVRVLVYTLAAWAVLKVVPGLALPPTPFVAPPYGVFVSYLGLGVLYGALQAVARPFLLFFAGRLYIWSLGLVAVVANGLLFLGLAYLSPEPLGVPGGEIFSAALGTLLMANVVQYTLIVIGLFALVQTGFYLLTRWTYLRSLRPAR